MFILHILLFNRYVVINHTNICLDLNVFLEKSILHVLVPKKNSSKFQPNFAKFGSFGGDRNFCNTKIKNPAENELGKSASQSERIQRPLLSWDVAC